MRESLYDHAGGDVALHRLEELFYDRALADPLLRRLFSERVPTHVDHLTWFTAESFGGPDRFTDRAPGQATQAYLQALRERERRDSNPRPPA